MEFGYTRRQLELRERAGTLTKELMDFEEPCERRRIVVDGHDADS